MEQNPGLLSPEDREAALESFKFFERKAAWSVEQSKRMMEDAERHYLDIKARYDADLKEQKQYERLVKLYSNDVSPPEPASSEVLVSQDWGKSFEAVIVEGNEPKKRNSYSVSTKEKLKELIVRAEYFYTDQELKSSLQFELNTNEIPIKTIQNRLFDLDNEGVIKRRKVPGTKVFVSGLPEWFDSEGNPLPERLEYKNLRV